MWGATEGLFVLVVIIFIFGIISLPRPRKTRVQVSATSGIAQQGSGNQVVGDVGNAQKSAFKDDPYVTDQKGVEPMAAEEKKA